MNDYKGNKRIRGKSKEWETKEPDTIETRRGLRETQPAKGQREGNQTGEHHAPEDALVRDPAIQAAPTDKRLVLPFLVVDNSIFPPNLRSTHNSPSGPAAHLEKRAKREDTSRSGRGEAPCTPSYEWISVLIA